MGLLGEVREDESGSSLLEFGISAALMLIVIFAIADLSRALYADHFVSEAARSATRYAMVRGSSWKNAPCSTVATYSCTATSTDVSAYVRSILTPGLTSANLVVTPTWTGKTAIGTSCTSTAVNDSPGCLVTVQVTYHYNFIFPFLPQGLLALTSTSSVAISQ